MRICLTGSTGFIGAAFLPFLDKRGHDVVVLTRRDLVATRLPDPGPVDAFVHLAGKAHVTSRHAGDEAAYRHVNVGITERLAEQAVISGATRFLFVSSIGVHRTGLSARKAITEDSPIDPEGPYAVSKWEAEAHLLSVARQAPLEVVIVRPALVVGSGAPGNLARLGRLLATGLPIPVPGQDNERAYVCLQNLLELLFLGLTKKEAAGQTFVAAEEAHPSTRQVMEWIAAGMGKRRTLMPVPTALLKAAAFLSGQAATYEKLFGNMRVDASKARSHLGWQSHESLGDAFRAVGHSYR